MLQGFGELECLKRTSHMSATMSAPLCPNETREIGFLCLNPRTLKTILLFLLLYPWNVEIVVVVPNSKTVRQLLATHLVLSTFPILRSCTSKFEAIFFISGLFFGDWPYTEYMQFVKKYFEMINASQIFNSIINCKFLVLVHAVLCEEIWEIIQK